MKTATFDTNRGTIVAALYEKDAPKTVENSETKGNPRIHELGALSMAHAGKDTGGSQFFIVLDETNTRHLNGVHTVFGKVTKGIDVVQKIQKDDVMNSVRVS